MSSRTLRSATPFLRDAERAVLVPGYTMGRQDKFKLALIGATPRGYVQQGDMVIVLVGPMASATDADEANVDSTRRNLAITRSLVPRR
jgi:hypothetical protein